VCGGAATFDEQWSCEPFDLSVSVEGVQFPKKISVFFKRNAACSETYLPECITIRLYSITTTLVFSAKGDLRVQLWNCTIFHSIYVEGM